MKIKAIIFDLDGTLLDTLDDLYASVNFALSTYHLPLRSKHEVKHFLGNGIGRLVSLSVPNGSSVELTENVLEEFRAHYLLHCQDKTRPFAGILPLLSKCQKKNIRTAIVSNKLDPAVQNLHEKFFDEYIDIAIGETPDLKRKPAPDMVLKALEELGCKPEDAIYVGDSKIDIETAKNAAIPCVAVSWGFSDKE